MVMEPITPHLLIVDDDERLRDLLSKYLKEQGFDVSKVACASDAGKLLQDIRFDLLILDVMMPDETGIEFTKRVIEQGYVTPILLLTARGDVGDRIIGLEAGADDYLSKPFEPKELLLRIQALLKRTKLSIPSSMQPEVQIGSFHFDKIKGVLRKGTRAISLTQTESDLLKVFVDHMGAYLSREVLSSLMGLQGSSRTIDVQITRLRKKIEDDPKNPKFLQTIRNKGYILWGH